MSRVEAWILHRNTPKGVRRNAAENTPFKVRSDIRSGSGGYVNGVYYPDMSGTCSGTTPHLQMAVAAAAVMSTEIYYRI